MVYFCRAENPCVELTSCCPLYVHLRLCTFAHSSPAPGLYLPISNTLALFPMTQKTHTARKSSWLSSLDISCFLPQHCRVPFCLLWFVFANLSFWFLGLCTSCLILRISPSQIWGLFDSLMAWSTAVGSHLFPLVTVALFGLYLLQKLFSPLWSM